MSDFRNYQDPNDPTKRDMQNLPPDDSMASNATWGWVAAAIFAVVVLFLAFTTGRDDSSQTAANRDMSTPATRTTPAPSPSPSTSGSATNSPASPSNPASPSPSAPAGTPAR
jgi:hypothetical protein